jgi:hypothetical protein
LTAGVLADLQHHNFDLQTADLPALAKAAVGIPGACAYGKIVVLAKDGIFTFQATTAGDTVPAFCGNSTAAAVSYLGGKAPIRATVHGTASYEVSARTRFGVVAQEWLVPAQAVAQRTWRGRQVLLLPTLNDYALVLGELPQGVCPEAVRRELLGAAGKLAVIGTGRNPIVEFYNSNGKHGGAPQTGLASIALAARALPWLNASFPDGQLTYLTEDGPRRAPLTAVSESACGRISITMPAVSVSLNPPAMKMVA